MPPRRRRQKISTTIAPENEAFLQSLVTRGKASSLADAVDHAVTFARRAEARKRLEEASIAYYAALSGKALKDEQKLERAIGYAASQVDFDGE
jgi:Arc/MetJ-type ribon-helix-helix transcriptional regulator